MSYVKKVWTNGVDVLDKTNLDHLETQYDEAIKTVRKTADETVNNSTVQQNDDELLFAVAANEVWVFDLYLLFTSSLVADFQFGFTAPVGCTLHWGVIGTGASVGYYTWGLNAVGVNPTGLLIVTAVLPVAGGGADIMGVRSTIMVINGVNAGNIQLQWAQNTGEASDTKVLTNSCIIAHKIS